MNQKRKAELQRKLAMTSVPKPPAGLSDRLKADIPANLMSVERDRERFARSSAFSLRVAASILLLVTSAYVAVHLMSRTSDMKIESAPPTMISKKSAPAAAPQAEVTITLAENDKNLNSGRLDDVAPALERKVEEAAKPAAPARQEREKLAKVQPPIDEERDQKASKDKDSFGERAAVSRVAAVSAPAAVPPPAPPPPVAAPVVAAAEPRANDEIAAKGIAASKTENITVTANAPEIVPTAQAASLSFKPPRAVFGLSIDPGAFARVKEEIAKGERPAAGTVDVAGVVNYFASGGRAPRRDVRLDVEASRAPVATDNTALLRFTIDTPRENIAGATLPPVATDADMTITLNSNVVLTHRLIGADQLKSQSTLLKNVSVTGLMEMKLKPGIPPQTTIATLRLRYRSVVDGKVRTIPREVHAYEVARSWASASLRHRLATLGAAWTESLHDGDTAGDVAKTAEKLAVEEPHDIRARELADLATASFRLQSSGPTGSGR